MIRAFLSAIFLMCASVVMTEAGTIVQNINDISYWVGSGENRAVLIIDWEDNKNAPGESAGEAVAWGYRWPVGQTRTGRDMLEAIAAADSRLFLQTDNRGFGTIVFGLAYDLDGDGGSFQFDLSNEEGGASDPQDHFGEGWRNAFWGYKVGTTGSSTNTLPVWGESSLGFSSRILANNSWDAWVLSYDLVEFTIPDPSLALAAPEPSTAALLVSGAILLLRRRIRI